MTTVYPTIVKCRHCGFHFKRERHSQQICSPQCIKERRRAMDAQRSQKHGRPTATKLRECRNCGAVFVRGVISGLRAFCSVECRRTRRLKQQIERQNHYLYRERLRAEGGDRWERFKKTRRVQATSRYHQDAERHRARGRKNYKRLRELALKGLALEQLQQEGLL